MDCYMKFVCHGRAIGLSFVMQLPSDVSDVDVSFQFILCIKLVFTATQIPQNFFTEIFPCIA